MHFTRRNPWENGMHAWEGCEETGENDFTAITILVRHNTSSLVTANYRHSFARLMTRDETGGEGIADNGRHSGETWWKWLAVQLSNGQQSEIPFTQT